MKYLVLLWIICISSLNYVLGAPTIKDVYLRFCDNGDQLTKQTELYLSAAQTWSVCMQFINNSMTDVSLDIGVRDWMLTADTMQNKSCNGEWMSNILESYITLSAQSITIPAWSSKKITGNIFFPDNTPWGEILACIAYMDAQPKGKTWLSIWNSMFAIKQRTVNLLTIHLSGDISLWVSRDIFPTTDNNISPQSISNNPVIYANNNIEGLWIKSIFSNTWSVNEQLIMTGTITTMRWKKTILTNNKIIPTKWSTTIELLYTGSHRYDWYYELEIQAEHKPIINTINSKTYPSTTLTQQAVIYVLPLLEIILWLLIICTIYLIIILSKQSKQQRIQRLSYTSKYIVPTAKKPTTIKKPIVSTSIVQKPTTETAIKKTISKDQEVNKKKKPTTVKSIIWSKKNQTTSKETTSKETKTIKKGTVKKAI